MVAKPVAFSGEYPGLDLDEFLPDGGLRLEVVWQFLLSMEGNFRGYLLRYQPSQDEAEDWFEPDRAVGIVPNLLGVQDPTVLPNYVESAKLFDDQNEWLSAARNDPVPGTKPLAYPDAISRWQVLVLSGDRRWGYLKIIQLGGVALTEFLFQTRCQAIQGWLEKVVTDRLRWWGSVRPSVELARQRLQSNPRSALSAVASLLTGHQGADFNRAAYFAYQAESQTYRCLYAHGGDDSEAHRDLQRRVAESGPMERLPTIAGTVPPYEDPLTRDLIGVEGASWPAGRSLVDLASDPATLKTIAPGSLIFAEDHNPIGTQLASGWIGAPLPLGCLLGPDDPWIQDLRSRFPNNALFRTRSERWVVIPWRLPGLLPRAFFLLDLAARGPVSADHDLRPRCQRAAQLLSAVSADP